MFTEKKIKFEKPDLPDLSTLHPVVGGSMMAKPPRYCLSVLVQLKAAQGAHGTLSQPGQGDKIDSFFFVVLAVWRVGCWKIVWVEKRFTFLGSRTRIG